MVILVCVLGDLSLAVFVVVVVLIMLGFEIIFCGVMDNFVCIGFYMIFMEMGVDFVIIFVVDMVGEKIIDI